jgi:hypothetical protein
MIGLPGAMCRRVVPMELLVFYPSDARPKKRHFDGPVSLGVQQAVGENPELVPGFTSISRDGLIYPCVAYCDREAKRNGSPMNAWASALWHAALKGRATNVVYGARMGP